jgi:predicted NBD/HSP70 family sugar kinase
MRSTLPYIANRLLLDGENLRRNGGSLGAYYSDIEVAPSTVASATAGLGMSRPNDPVRIFITRENGEGAALAFGPSAGLVLGVSIGYSSIRAALVDANGWMHHQTTGETMVGQLQASPPELFDRIKSIAEHVLEPALHNQRLLVSGTLPLLGVSVAWPGPLDRDKRFPRVGLSHPDWQTNDLGIDERLARHLHFAPQRSHAIDNAAAGALAVAFDRTRDSNYRQQHTGQPIIVVRAGGGLSAASVLVQPQTDGASGWVRSELVEGDRGLAGQIGHTPVNRDLLVKLSDTRPEGCPGFAVVSCSCAKPDETPDHVEAYASCPAVAARFGANDVSRSIREVIANQAKEPYLRTLEEVGQLVADCLLPSVLMLNPHGIVLTGGLATEPVQDSMQRYLNAFGALGRVFGSAPSVHTLQGEDNDYVRVRGAALSMLRSRVHCRIGALFGARGKLMVDRFGELTQPISRFPWTDR